MLCPWPLVIHIISDDLVVLSSTSLHHHNTSILDLALDRPAIVGSLLLGSAIVRLFVSLSPLGKCDTVRSSED